MGDKSTKIETIGLYVHVPFCAKHCDYCAFYQEKPEKEGIREYIETLQRELEQWPPHGPVGTIFMGGGTPSLLSVEDLERVCVAIRKTVERSWVVAGLGSPFFSSPHLTHSTRCEASEGSKGLSALGGGAGATPLPTKEIPSFEWTIEMAPGSVKAEKLEMLKRVGVNRFSMGVQSFDPKILEAIGRPHSVAQIEAAIKMIKEAGIGNWNIDLIFAAAEVGLEGWLKDLERAVAEGPTHISTYCLTFESDTKMFLKMLAGLKRKPSPEEEKRFYEATWKFFGENGYRQYEVSNFSKKGCECRHNVNTWSMREWVAYGPSAAWQVGCAPPCTPAAGGECPPAPRDTQSASTRIYKRATNVADIGKWEAGVKNGKRVVADEETLTGPQMAVDAIVFGLRMRAGVDVAQLQERFGVLPQKELENLKEELVAEGLLKVDGEKWALTDKGMLVADRVGAEVLERF